MLRRIDVGRWLALVDVDQIPFFIEWAADSPHPSQDSPKVCLLEVFELQHPKAESVRTALAQLGIDAAVRQAARARLTAT